MAKGKSDAFPANPNDEDAIGINNDEAAPLLSPEKATDNAKKGTRLGRVLARAGGLFAVALMIVSWIATGELVQGLTPEYPHPFAICYFTRLGWSCLLAGWAVWRFGWFPLNAPVAKRPDSPLGPFGWGTYLKWASILSIVGLISGWTWYISLEHTPLPSNTAVYQTAPVFVFMLSVPLLGEKVTWVKVLSTITCVAGAALVSFGKGGGQSSDEHMTNQGFGFAMCFLSTILYATFEVTYKLKATDSADPVKIPNAFRFLGMIGVGVILSTPMFPILHYTGVESFAWPNHSALKLILINCVLDAVFNTSLLVAIMLTSPLFCSVRSCPRLGHEHLVWHRSAHCSRPVFRRWPPSSHSLRPSWATHFWASQMTSTLRRTLGVC